MIDTFLQNVAWLRKYYGLSKTEMAKRLGISRFTLNKIEKGELPPRLTIDILFYVHKNFDISLDDVLSRKLGCKQRD